MADQLAGLKDQLNILRDLQGTGGIPTKVLPKLQAPETQALVVQRLQNDLGPSPSAPSALPDWFDSHYMDFDPLSGTVNFKDSLQTAFLKKGFDHEQVAQLEHKLSQKLGAYRGSGTFVGDLAKSELPSDLKGPKPKPGTPEAMLASLDKNKARLFGDVASALSSEADPYKQAAIVRQAFAGSQGGVNQQLLKEFGDYAKLTDEASKRKIEQQLQEQKKAPPHGFLGQLSRALGVPADVLIREPVGLIENAFGGNAKTATGERVSVHTLLEAIKNIPAGVAETSTLGGAGLLPDILKATGHDKAAEAAGKALLVNRGGEVGFSNLAPVIDKLKNSKHQDQQALGTALDFLGNALTDPLTYATLGAGGVGKAAASDILKGVVERGLVEATGEDAAKAAAFRVANTYARRINFQGALKAYESLGYNPQMLAQEFPKVGLGRTAADLAQVRGGLTLRAGVPGTNLKAAVNLISGGSRAESVVRPRIVANLIDHAAIVGDKLVDKYDAAARVYRYGLGFQIQREHPELAARFKQAVRAARGVSQQTTDQAVGTFRRAEQEMRAIAKGANLSEDEFLSAVNDMIEQGASGIHYDELVARVGPAKADAFAEHAAKINDTLTWLRFKALASGVDVPELADQALGNINYLTHGLTDFEKERLRASGGGFRGASKAERKLHQGSAVGNVLTQEAQQTTGTLNDVNRIWEQFFGEKLLNPNSFESLNFYARALGHRIGVEETLTHLQGDLGFPNIESDIAAGLHGIISDPKAVRDVYLSTLNRARQQASAAGHNLRVGTRNTQAVARSYAETTKRLSQDKLETLGQLQQLRVLKEWNAENIAALTKSAAERQQMANTAAALYEHERSIFSAQQAAEVQALKEAGALPKAIKATTAKWEAYIAQAKDDFHKIQQTLKQSPEAFRREAEKHLRGLTPEGVALLQGSGGRPLEAILRDGADTWETLERLKTIQRYGAKNPFEAISRAAAEGEFQIVQRDAVALSQRMGDLQARIDNATKAGRQSRAAELQAEYDATEQVFNQMVAQIKQNEGWTQQLLENLDNPEIARVAAQTESNAADYIPVDDLLAEQKAAIEAGDTAKASQLAQQISVSRELGQRVQLAQEYSEAKAAMQDLAGRGIRPDQISQEMVRSLRQHLADTINELNDLAGSGRLVRDPRRAQQALAIRYLRESPDRILVEDWLQEESLLQNAVQNSHTLQEQIYTKQLQLKDLVKQGKLKAYELKRAQQGLANLTAANADAVAKLLSTPDLIEQMVPDFAQLSVVAEKVPGTSRTVAMPTELYSALQNIRNAPAARGNALAVLRWFTNGWKRGTLAIPGSVGRRMIGEIINASYYGGLNVNDIKFGAKLAKAARAAHGEVDALPLDLQELGRGLFEQRILEGKLIDVYAEGGIDTSKGLLGNKIAPVKRLQSGVYKGTEWGEDILRAAMFAKGKAEGLTDVGARAKVAQYMFFHDELSPLESSYLRNIIPFWTYFRNNTQLQLYALFQTPGKIANYFNFQRSIQAQQQSQFGPNQIFEQGGFPLPIHNSKGQLEVLFPGLFDIPQGLLTLPTAGQLPIDAALALATGKSSQGAATLGGNEVLSNLNPAVGAATAAVLNKNLLTGSEYSQGGQPIAPFGHQIANLTPRQRAIFEQLIPEARQLEQLTLATPQRAQAPLENILSLLVGPTVRPISETTQNYSAGNLVAKIEALNKGLPASIPEANGTSRPPKIADVRKGAKKQRAQQLLEQYLSQISG